MTLEITIDNSVAARVERETGLSAEHSKLITDVLSPDLAEVFLDHCPSETFEQLRDVFIPVIQNLDAFAEVFESTEFDYLREEERARRKEKGYTTGVIGCIDGRVWQLTFGFPLNTSINREPAGLLETDLGAFTDQALLETIETRLRSIDDLANIEFFTSHTSFDNQQLDDHGHVTVCGATRAALGDDFNNFPDGGLQWDMKRKKPLIDMFEDRLDKDKTRGVETIYDTDSIGLVFGAEQLNDRFLTKNVISQAHEDRKVLFTDIYRGEPEVSEALAQSGYEQGEMSNLFGKPEHLMTVLKSLVATRDHLYNSLSDSLRPRLEKIYDIEDNENSLNAKMVDAVMDKAFWNVAFQHLSGWGSLYPDHPLRHHNESYVLCGPKGETHGLDPASFWAKRNGGVNVALTLFPPNDPVLISFTEIADGAYSSGASQAVGRAAEDIRDYINASLEIFDKKIRLANDQEDLQEAEDALRLFLTDYESDDPKLRPVLLPILLLQRDTRRVLQENGEREPGVNSDYVTRIIPELHERLLRYRNEIQALKN